MVRNSAPPAEVAQSVARPQWIRRHRKPRAASACRCRQVSGRGRGKCGSRFCWSAIKEDFGSTQCSGQGCGRRNMSLLGVSAKCLFHKIIPLRLVSCGASPVARDSMACRLDNNCPKFPERLRFFVSWVRACRRGIPQNLITVPATSFPEAPPGLLFMDSKN